MDRFGIEETYAALDVYKRQDEYMFRLVVETKYASSKIQEILKQKPIRLPAWDPMFAGEE